MADSTDLPGHVNINGIDYVKASEAIQIVGDPWQQYGGIISILGTIGVVLVMLMIIGCYWYWMANSVNSTENWRCQLFSHRIKHDKLTSSNYTNVGTAEVIYCRRCMKKIDLTFVPLEEARA